MGVVGMVIIVVVQVVEIQGQRRVGHEKVEVGRRAHLKGGKKKGLELFKVER